MSTMCHATGVVDDYSNRYARRATRLVFKYAPQLGQAGIEPTTKRFQDETASRQSTSPG